jgi:hypothetical protein
MNGLFTHTSARKSNIRNQNFEFEPSLHAKMKKTHDNHDPFNDFLFQYEAINIK